MSLYVWGSNKSKQLNNQKELHSYAPVYIPSTCGDNVPKAVASGDSHTIVLCDSGDIYTFGRDREGQLGHGSGGADCAEARVVAGLNEETVIDITAGALSSFAVTSTGNVYQW
jgi:alpha-tubulin suppressor-like RCC1 family protein